MLAGIDTLIHGFPSVLWTSNGYHICQPMEGFILEEEERLTDSAGNSRDTCKSNEDSQDNEPAN